MARARLSVEGLREAIQRVDDVGARARAPEPVLRAPGTRHDIHDGQERRFDRWTGWQRVTPRWAAEKRRRGLDPRTLHATGQLRAALTTGGRGTQFSVWNRELRWGILRGRSDLYYAQALARGMRGARPRRMVVIDRTARERIARRIQEYLASGIIGG